MPVSVCVVGSCNTDLVVRANALPRPGETVLGSSFARHPGGKGANQAVAAGRLGADVALVAAVGEDAWGKELRAVLASEGLELSGMQTLADVPTGIATIVVLPDGQDGIVVAPGANGALTPKHVEAAGSLISRADVLLLQGEVPVDATRRAIEIAAASETRVVLNAAPAAGCPADQLGRVSLLVCNLGEARALARCEEDVSASGLARRLDALGPDRVAVTLGDAGAVLFDGETLHRAEAFPIDAVDAVGAGDAFVAALAVALAEGTRSADALRFACAAGALAASREGAIPALPRREEVDELVGKPADRATSAG